MNDFEKAAGIVAKHFPLVAPDMVTDLAMKVVFATDLFKTATPADPRNAARLADIKRAEKHLPEWNRLFARSPPDTMDAVAEMLETERLLANAARILKARVGPPDYVLVTALVGAYREAAGKEPSIAVDRESGRAVAGEFSKFVDDVSRTFCTGEPPSLDTLRRVLYPHAR